MVTDSKQSRMFCFIRQLIKSMLISRTAAGTVEKHGNNGLIFSQSVWAGLIISIFQEGNLDQNTGGYLIN